MANHFLTYILWLFGGFAGLHHLYLGREFQAVFYAITCGGFGIGWVLDLFRIPSYVNESNGTPEYLEQLTTSMKYHKGPSMTLTILASQWLFGAILGYLGGTFAPPNFYRPIYHILICLGCSLGVYLTGTGLDRRCKTSFPMVFLFCGMIHCANLAYHRTLDDYVFAHSLLGAIVAFHSTKSWIRIPLPSRPLPLRFLRYLCLAGIFYCVVLNGLYQHGAVNTIDPQTGKIKRVTIANAIHNILKSPIFEQSSSSFRFSSAWEDIHQQGFEYAWEKIKVDLDPQGKGRAYKILGLESGSSFEEIKKSYKKLALEWHPDKHRHNKEMATQKFVEIQEAYAILSKDP